MVTRQFIRLPVTVLFPELLGSPSLLIPNTSGPVDHNNTSSMFDHLVHWVFSVTRITADKGPGRHEAVEMEMQNVYQVLYTCLLYTSDAADEGLGVDLGGRRII